MGYQKAEEILPAEVIELIQRYVDGQAIYIPRIPGKRQKWVSGTKIQKELQIRNQRIFLIMLEEHRLANWLPDIFCRSRAYREL